MGVAGKDAPAVTGWQLDRKTFTATPVMSDGSPGPRLELRALFEEFETEIR
jgi:hypothetical protein